MRRTDPRRYLALLNCISEKVGGATVHELKVAGNHSSRQATNYYLTTLAQWGLIERQGPGRDHITIWHLTRAGAQAVTAKELPSDRKTMPSGASPVNTHRESSLPPRSNPQSPLPSSFSPLPGPSPRYDHIHHIAFKADLRTPAPNLTLGNVNDRMRGWVKEWDWFTLKGTEVLVEYHEPKRPGKAGSIVLKFQIHTGSGDPWRDTSEAWRLAARVLTHLEGLYTFAVGHPHVAENRWHYSIKDDPVAKAVGGTVKVFNEIGQIDRSHYDGELEYYAPADVDGYLRQPRRVKEILDRVGQVLLKMDAQDANFAQMASLMERALTPAKPPKENPPAPMDPNDEALTYH